jgi:hypothetical protein
LIGRISHRIYAPLLTVTDVAELNSLPNFQHKPDKELRYDQQSQTQIQTSNSKTTGVFALLTAKPGITREQVLRDMPAEIRATVQLYLGGKIRGWYSREDGRGAIFLLNTNDVREAQSIMESLPLAHEDLLDHEYVAVGPLMPLGLLIGGQPPSQ